MLHFGNFGCLKASETFWRSPWNIENHLKCRNLRGNRSKSHLNQLFCFVKYVFFSKKHQNHRDFTQILLWDPPKPRISAFRAPRLRHSQTQNFMFSNPAQLLICCFLENRFILAILGVWARRTSLAMACATRMGRSEGGSLSCIALVNFYCITCFIQDVNQINSESQ